MVQKGNSAAVKDAQIKLSKEEFASSMGQNTSSAALKGVQIKLSAKEYVRNTENIAIHTMNLLHLDQSTRRLPQLKPYPISLFLELSSEEEEEEEAFLER